MAGAVASLDDYRPAATCAQLFPVGGARVPSADVDAARADCAVLLAALRLGAVRGEKPRFGQDDVQRIRSVLGQICAEVVSDSGSVLMVTHGDVLAQWVEMATRETVLQCDYCGFIASRRAGGGSAAAPTPADFERVAAEGVMSMFTS